MNLLPSVDKLKARVIRVKGLNKVVTTSLEHHTQYAISRFEEQSYLAYGRYDEALAMIKERVARDLWYDLYGVAAHELREIKRDLMECIARERSCNSFGYHTTDLADLLAHLTILAAAHKASTTHVVQLDFAGFELVYHWEASNDVPRQVNVYFDLSNQFVYARVLEPSLFMVALDAGMTWEDADRESRRVVGAVEDVTCYLLAQGYRSVSSRRVGS